jgi:hypothetical protein
MEKQPMPSPTPAFPALDFDHYHSRELPQLLAAGRAALVEHAVQGLAPLALRRKEGGAYTYRPTGAGVAVESGEAGAETVMELGHEDWQGLVHELEAPAGLLYAGRLRCLRGNAMQLMAWEPALRALYNGRPRYDADQLDLRDRQGAPLDPERSFTLDDDPQDLSHFLRTAGYLFVRNVLRPDEIARLLSEADVLRAEARKGDKLSWWGKNADGDEILCRVTRANSQPGFAALPDDPRILGLRDLADEELVAARGEGTGVTVIFKHPRMSEGLGDIPWHRDCGMGGHAAMCPVLLLSLYLSEATPESGDLRMLPGSREASLCTMPPDHPEAPRGARFRARPGDVSLHYGDTMHAAPPPSDPNRDAYRISTVLGWGRAGGGHHRGEGSYNQVLHGREDGQVEHLEKVAGRS